MMDPASTTASTSVQGETLLGIDHSARGRRWVRRPVDARQVETMVQQGIEPALAEVLSGRGIDAQTAPSFLAAKLKDSLPDPNVLVDMDKATARLADAIEDGEIIGIFGDYDVDGTVSAALLSRYLDALGAPYKVHLPDRKTEGYGPNIQAFQGLGEHGARLIVTVDCGATAHSVIAEANEAGQEIIVLDHHLMEARPDAVAVVNPNRPDDSSGLTMLSAGGVVFMTMIALNRTLRERGYFASRAEPKLLAWLDLVALSLVCDVMPLKGLTRVLVRQGLNVLGKIDEGETGNPGLRGLARDAGASGPAQASHFGFSVGPRINAAGRIGHAKLAYDVLMADDAERVEELATRLGDLNGARQGVEAAVLDQALVKGAEKAELHPNTPLVVEGDGWHPGVIGIVAGRLKERFDRPSIVIAFEGDEGKGSGRSIPGVDLGEAISGAVAAGVLSGGGGHPMAAGLSLHRDQLASFEAYLADRLRDTIETARADQVARFDGLVSASAVTASFADAIAGAGPFGNGNPEPRFVLNDIRVAYVKVLKEKHMAVTAQDQMGRQARCIAFGCVGQPLGDLLSAAADDGLKVHLAGRVKPDDWRGGNCGQLQIDDAALAVG